MTEEDFDKAIEKHLVDKPEQYRANFRKGNDEAWRNRYKLWVSHGGEFFESCIYAYYNLRITNWEENWT